MKTGFIMGVAVLGDGSCQLTREPVTKRVVKFAEMLSDLIDASEYRGQRKKITRSLGISASLLSQYTHGRARPSFDRLVALADLFDVSLDHLVYGDELLPPPTPDQSPLAPLITEALNNAAARASRHSDLVTRIGRVLGDRIDQVAQALALSNTAGREGLIQYDELMRMEGCCQHADIVAIHLGFDIIQLPSVEIPAKGVFFDVVAANLRRGSKYRFLLPGGEHDYQQEVADFRRLLAPEVGGPGIVREYCAFREAQHPMVSGIGIYYLDLYRLHREQQMLIEQFGKYITPDGWLGYIIRPNDDSNADMLMSVSHAATARRAFDSIWARSRPL